MFLKLKNFFANVLGQYKAEMIFFRSALWISMFEKPCAVSIVENAFAFLVQMV